MNKTLTAVGLSAALLGAAACSDNIWKGSGVTPSTMPASTGATSSSGSSIPSTGPDAGYNSTPGTPGRDRPADKTDLRGRTTQSPGMDTSHGGSTTQSLGVQPPGAGNTGE
jgi:hypothetical protein